MVLVFLILRFIAEHNSYWSRFPGKYEHWRFGAGFVQGWNDAYEFFKFAPDIERPVSELGFTVTMRKKRSAEHIAQKGAGNNVWEYGLFCVYISIFELRSVSLIGRTRLFARR
jgi:glucan 1,3-beta-glucosidase